MTLTFSILWFDDNREFLDSLDLDPLKEEVNSWGFVLSITFVNTPEDFIAQSPFRQFDLIVVDYNLGDNQPHGEEFIKNIREHGVFTEIVFYSTNPAAQLWVAIAERQLEGIFVANRGVIREKVQRVARQTVHKVLDLNNMRGMVMAEVGDLDLILESILRKGIAALNENDRNALYMRFHEKTLELATKQGTVLKEFSQKPDIDSLIALCDSAKRWTNLKRLSKYNRALAKLQIGDYLADVLVPRNFLAHGHPEPDGSGYSFTYQNKTYKFDEAKSLALRQIILKYKEAFEKMEMHLSSNAART